MAIAIAFAVSVGRVVILLLLILLLQLLLLPVRSVQCLSGGGNPSTSLVEAEGNAQ